MQILSLTLEICIFYYRAKQMKRILIFLLTIFTSVTASAGLWIGSYGGNVPDKAYQVGSQPDGGPLFLCKSLYNGQMYIGNINSRFGGCNITVKGNVLTIKHYLVWTVDLTQS